MTSSKTAKLTGSAPVIFVRDVYAATKHYRDAMGFSFEEIFGEPPSFAILRRDNMYIMVKQIEDHKHIVPRWTVSSGLWDMYFWVDDVDALYREFVERGAKIDYELCDQPYGCREFGTQDIDGHDIGFGQVTRPQTAPLFGVIWCDFPSHVRPTNHALLHTSRHTGDKVVVRRYTDFYATEFFA